MPLRIVLRGTANWVCASLEGLADLRAIPGPGGCDAARIGPAGRDLKAQGPPCQQARWQQRPVCGCCSPSVPAIPALPPNWQRCGLI